MASYLDALLFEFIFPDPNIFLFLMLSNRKGECKDKPVLLTTAYIYVYKSYIVSILNWEKWGFAGMTKNRQSKMLKTLLNTGS